MQNNSNQAAQKCLLKLETLKQKIQRLMEIRQNANFLNKYRINFEITQPTNLVGGTLQQHQLQSLEWMINLASQEANGILADDMGLGKTIQAISYMAYLKQENGIRGKHMIICPKSVSTNWMRQLKKWFPSSRAELLVNTELQRQNFIKEVIHPRKFDILVTTYQGAKKCLYVLQKIKWETIVVDQAHKIKNFASQNFKAISHFQATFKLLLSGTPLSNNLKELWTLLYFIMPQLFNDPALFDQIEQSVQAFQGTEEQKLDFRLKIAKYFHTIINPFFKRRSKKDLQLGLPPKIEKTLYVPLSKMQLQMYKNFIRYGNVYGDSNFSNRNVMNARKICLHPYLFEDMWPQNQEDFGQHAIENCGKLKVLDKLLKKLLQQGHKVLIFTQFTQFLDLLQEYCEYRSFKYCRLDGNTALQERDQLTNNFNNTDMYQIFMLSTRAGGLGINLTGADRVIIYDIDWNPQNDIQAMDRAYRMGQTKPVHVYKLITQFTIEQRISQFQRYKLVWDELVIQKGAFMAKKQISKDDPFSNISVQSLAKIGKGQIFRLKVDQTEKTIEQIEQLGQQKNRQLDDNIRKKLQDNIENYDMNKFNPFEQDTQECIPEPNRQQTQLKRRNYQNFARQKQKFDRYNAIPAFKFYVKMQKIRELEFELHMELKREQSDRSANIISYLQDQLDNIYTNQKFHQWSQKQFQDFVDAHQTYSQKNYQKIAQFIKTKTPLQVENYSKTFFEKAPNNERLEKELEKIMLGQKLVKLRANRKNQTKRQQSKNSQSVRNSSKEIVSPETTIMTTQLMQKQITRLEDKKIKQEQKLKKAAIQREQRNEKLKKLKEDQKKAKQQQKIKLKQMKQIAKKQKADQWAKILEERKQNQLKAQEQKQARRKAKLQSRQIAKKQKLDLQKSNRLNKENKQMQQLTESQDCSSKSTQKKNYDGISDEYTNSLDIRPQQLNNTKNALSYENKR